MRDNLPTMLRDAAKEWRKENKVVATGATRYDFALEEAADAIEELTQEEKFYEFLWNTIQPNEMELYIAMYRAQAILQEQPKEE